MDSAKAESAYTGDAGLQYARRFPDAASDILGRCFVDRTKGWIALTDTVFEFGCGNGRNLLALRSKEKAGFDVNEHSRAVAVRAGLKVYDCVDDIPRTHWSVVVCNHVLEHVGAPLDTLRLLKSLLAPRGKLILTVPLEGHLLDLKEMSQDIDHHLYCWNPTTMRNLMYVSGFQLEKLVVRSAAYEDRLEPVSRLSWGIFRLGVWLAGAYVRRREMMCVARAA